MISIIYQHILAYFAVFMIISVLFNVKPKIAINGFVMERVRMIMEAIFYGIWSKLIIKKFKFILHLL
jgi:hypothetical protein